MATSHGDSEALRTYIALLTQAIRLRPNAQVIKFDPQYRFLSRGKRRRMPQTASA
jgi:hypothetical protein